MNEEKIKPSKSTDIKNVIQWILAIFIVILLSMLVISAIVQMLAPTFFPSKDISGFISVINTASIFLSVISTVFGILSLIFSYQSGKQAEKILDGVSDLRKHCDTMESILDNMSTKGKFSFNSPTPIPSNEPDKITD